MIPGGPAETYLRALREALGTRPADRILAEVEEHLRDSIEDLGSRGHGPLESERIAAERMGPAEAAAREILDLPREPTVPELLRIPLLALAALTSLFALVALFFTLRDPDGWRAFSTVKVAAFSAVLFVASRTFRGESRPGGILWGGLFLVNWGSWMIAHGTYLALIGRDPEYYVPAAGGLLAAQGFLTLLLLVPSASWRRLRRG